MKQLKILFTSLVLLSCTISLYGISDEILKERVYLQTDKQSYLAGELAWIKLITISEEGIPIDFSKVGYIEILDGEVSHLQVKVDIRSGIATSWFVVPSTLLSGNYSLVAYTQYMKNETPLPYFKKEIVVVNTSQKVFDKPEEITQEEAYLPSQHLKNRLISISSDKHTYNKREKVDLRLSDLPSNIKTLSVVVTGEDFYKNPYQSPTDYWDYNWTENKNTKFEEQYWAECEGHIIRGHLLNNETGTRSCNANLKTFASFVGDEINLFQGNQDTDGNIYFITDNPLGKEQLVLSIANDNVGEYKLGVEYPYFRNFNNPRLAALEVSNIDRDLLMQRNIGLQVMYAYQGDELEQFFNPRVYYFRKPDNSYIMAEYEKFNTMQEVSTEFLERVRFKEVENRKYLTTFRLYEGYSQDNLLAMMDGIPIYNHGIIYNYNPLLIKKTEVFFDRFLVGDNIFDGILNFTTKDNKFPDLIPDASTSIYNYTSPQIDRLFYSPTYDSDRKIKQSVNTPDYRHTLYWNPCMSTDLASPTSFYTSDVEGKYKVVLEGITNEGEFIHGTLTIEIK